MIEICGGLVYETWPSDSRIITYGDVGDKFFIVLKGKVSVWVPVSKEDME